MTCTYRTTSLSLVMTLLALSPAFGTIAAAQQKSLDVTFGSRGVQSISYGGQVLEDTRQFPDDGFQIGHIKATDLRGNVLTGADYTWGENNKGKVWDASTRTWTYRFVWGSIQVQFVVDGDTINTRVTQSNLPGSGVILSGASIVPFVLRFPVLPKGFVDPSYSQLSINLSSPSVTLADFGSGEVAAVAPDAAMAIYSGFQPAGSANAYYPLLSSTTPDNLPTFQSRSDRMIRPGSSETYVVSLRFAPSGSPLGTLAADAFDSWSKTWPEQLHWSDRRVIGTIYLASSVPGDKHVSSGFPNNPRRYFNESNPEAFDVRNASGLTRFQARVMKQAADSVVNLQRLNAQGAITWDLEGDEYPMDTTYLCSPDQIGTFAPEMESVISDSASPYVGLHLVDAYFKAITSAGFRVGVCIRPQQLTKGVDGSASQNYIPSGAVAAQLIGKMKYAHDRWGATLFYIDSSVDSNGAPVDAAVMQQVAAALPDSLLIPEESAPKGYAYTAPFRTFIFHGDVGRDPSVANFYPQAFSAILVNDADPTALAAHRGELTASVARGDILMAHATYWQENNPTIIAIYADAGVGQVASSEPPVSPVVPDAPVQPVEPLAPVILPPAPAQLGPVEITSPAAGSTITGIGSVTANVAVNMDAAASLLLVDGVERGLRRVASPPFFYEWDSTALPDGVHLLQVSAHSISNITSVSPAISVIVSNHRGSTPAPPKDEPIATPPLDPPPAVTPTYPIALISPVSGQSVSGVVQVVANITQTLDAAGSYLLIDGVEWGTQRTGSAPYVYSFDSAAFGKGSHTLQIWAHDIGNNTLLSNSVTIMIP